ncbi:MAG: RNA polymerase sigma factor [Alphaproteobacteria bacterium]
MALQKTPPPDFDDLAEADLVSLAQQGFREAFRVIMQRCNQRLFRVARAIVRNEAEAEDVVQEAYTRAFAKLDTFRGEASILTWLTRITLNEARGRLRAQRNNVGLDEVDTAQGSHVIPFPSNNEAEMPEASAARMQIRRLIEQAVDELPVNFRVVFVMRDVEDCSILETASFLAIRPETVKTRLHRARRLLRSALDEKIGAGMKGAFPFLGARCQRMTEAVLARLCPAS